MANSGNRQRKPNWLEDLRSSVASGAIAEEQLIANLRHLPALKRGEGLDSTPEQEQWLLEALTERFRRLALLTAEIDGLVAVARAAGISWARIGAAVGIKAQSAHERWRDKVQG